MSALKILLLSLLMMVAISRSMPDLTPGRWSRTKILPPQVDRWVKNKHPELKEANAVHIESQVVKGTNYKITYEGASIKALV